jgi:hypothetical protein
VVSRPVLAAPERAVVEIAGRIKYRRRFGYTRSIGLGIARASFLLC